MRFIRTPLVTQRASPPIAVYSTAAVILHADCQRPWFTCTRVPRLTRWHIFHPKVQCERYLVAFCWQALYISTPTTNYADACAAFSGRGYGKRDFYLPATTSRYGVFSLCCIIFARRPIPVLDSYTHSTFRCSHNACIVHSMDCDRLCAVVRAWSVSPAPPCAHTTYAAYTTTFSTAILFYALVCCYAACAVRGQAHPTHLNTFSPRSLLVATCPRLTPCNPAILEDVVPVGGGCLLREMFLIALREISAVK